MPSTPAWATVEVCPVCDHDGWCATTTDETVVMCRRDANGHQRTDKSGVPYWMWHRAETGEYQPGSGSHTTIPTDDVPVPDVRRYYSHERLPVALLSIAYRALLGSLTLNDAHRQALQTKRRLSADEIERGLYKSMPGSFEVEQAALGAVAKTLISARFPDMVDAAQEERDVLRSLLGDTDTKSFSSALHDKLGEDRRHEACNMMLGVPGVWRSPAGVWRFGTPATSGLLIPSLDVQGRIHAISIGLDNPTAKGGKYMPPVSPKKLEPGSASGSQSDSTAPHVLSPRSPSTLIVTEGHYKVACSLPWAKATYGDGVGIIGLASVGAHARLFDLLDRGEIVPGKMVLALDADAARKSQVAAALTTIPLGLAERGTSTDLLRWSESDHGKGLDDVVQRGKAGEIATLTGQAMWAALADIRVQAGLGEDERVHAHVVLSDVVERTKDDASYPFAPNIVRALALLDETSREHARLHSALAGMLKAKGMVRLDKAIRDARKAAAQAEAPEADDGAWAPEYVTDNGATCLVTKDGGCRRLANFVATISKVVSRDDGAAVEREFQLTGKTSAGITLPSAVVHADKLDDRAWVRRAWGGQAVVEAGRDTFGHLVAAIERGSKPEHAVIYTHTGWRTVDGKSIFLVPEHVPGIDVEIGGAAQRGRYHLPPPPDLKSPELHAAVRASISLLDISPAHIVVPVIAGAYLAPLCSSLDVDFAVWLAGLSGGLKSALAALAASHFGTFAFNALPLSWSSTANQIELALYKLADVVVAIDDFKPDIERGHVVASRTVQAIGNRANRGRLNRASQEIAARPPRAFVISTGEELPTASSDSTIGRLITIRVPKDALDKAAIIEATKLAPSLRLAMSGYVTWLASPGGRDIGVKYREKHVSRFEQTLAGSGHARTPRNLATLFAGLTTFLRFAVEIGALAQEEASSRAVAGQDALDLVGHEQAQSLADTTPHERYLTILRTMLTSGAHTLASRYSDLDAEKGVGWDDPAESRVYLHAEAVWHAVERWQTQAGGRWPYERTSLHRALVERGVARDGGDSRHPSLHRVRLGAAGKPTWVLDVDRSHFEHALRGESPMADAARRAAAEAEADAVVKHLNQTFPN